MTWRNKKLAVGSFEEELYGYKPVPVKVKGSGNRPYKSISKCDGCSSVGSFASGLCVRCRKPCRYCGKKVEHGASTGIAYHLGCAAKKRRKEISDGHL